MDYILAFLAGYMLNWYALGIICFFGILFEYSENRGLSVFTGIVAALTSFFYFKIPFIAIAEYATLYMVVGVCWSFWRYKRFVDKKVAIIKDKPSNSNYLKSDIENLHPSKMIGTITAWILIWPFSLVENLCGDIIKFVETLVTTVFKSIYHKIYTSAVSSIDLNKDTPNKPTLYIDPALNKNIW